MSELIDSFGRKIVYFRISLTDRCNFRCIYCSPSEKGFCFIRHQEIMRFEEILEIVRVAADMGLTRIRLTGGEPLVRKGIVDFIKKLQHIDQLEDISMTTNGYYLAEMASALKEAGLKRVNISLDSLQKDRFQQITGFDGLERVLQGINAALREGLIPVKLNVVLLKGINDDEVEDFIRLTFHKPLYIRFIELMPTNHELDMINQGHFISARVIAEKIRRKYPDLKPATMEEGVGPAIYYQLSGAKGMFGFISAVSQHFCAKCNRIRLTAEGKLRPCLFNSREINLKESLRRIPLEKKQARKDTIRDCLQEAIRCKPYQHQISEENSSEFDMSQIGG